MKNKKKFILYVTLYVIGYLYFCIYGGINYGMRVSDSQLLRHMVLFSDMPVGVIDLSISIFVWIIISFFLILFILWQTELREQKLNRVALICEGINMVVTCLSRGIVEWITGGGALSSSLWIIIFLTVIVGVAVGITYLVQKKNGMLNSYLGYSDIMTEEEFECWQKKRR